MNPLPQRPNPLQLLTAYNSAAQRWPGALRSALAILIPGVIALLLGYDYATVLISAGACAVIYGEGHPYRTRARIIAAAGVLLLAATTTGALVGLLVVDHNKWWLLLSAAYVISIGVIGVYVQNSLRLPPPGCFFLIMVGGGSTMLPRADINPWQAAFWCFAGVVASLIIGLAPALLDKHGPERRAVEECEKAAAAFESATTDALARHHQAQTALFAAWQALADAAIVRGGHIINESQSELVTRTLAAQQRVVHHHQLQNFPTDSGQLVDFSTDVDPDQCVIPLTRPTIQYRLYRAATKDSHPVVAAEKVLLAAVATAVVGVALGLNRPDWGAVSVLLLMQWGPDRVSGTVRGLHRMVGSIVGVGLFALFHMFGLHGWTLLIALAACQYAAETLVARNYALCVIFSTPLALLMGNSATVHIGPAVASRVAEIALSVVFSLLLLWLWRPGSELRDHQRLQKRSEQAIHTLLGALLFKSPDEALTLRRDLQLELLSERRSIQAISINQPHQAERYWQRHLDIQEAGYHLLDFCSTHPDRKPNRDEMKALVHDSRVSTSRG